MSPTANEILFTTMRDSCLGESIHHWYTILLFSAYPKIVAASTQTFTTINKSSR